ncbi:hypothetical protein WQO_10365 [Streptomyces globisporus C-1027]|uniref:Uncharacterized protein n=1 Tax=Streptomyces globisporus C-1027 TaxID=1172567 RepID=A0A0U3KLI0_STRGL|nr:hypothetical protein WQO_10365 [Streptomyces globisporus C-1027]
MYPRLARRARHYVAEYGFAAATIELPGCGVRPRWAAAEQARADLRRAMAVESGGVVGGEIVDALILPLVDRAVPEWQAVLDELLALPGIGGPVGYEGGVISIGVRLAVVEPRIVAAGLFAGSLVPAAVFEEAAGSRFPCTSCCSGTTRATTGRRPWTCSTPSGPGRRPCTPTSAGTPAYRSSNSTRGPVLRPALDGRAPLTGAGDALRHLGQHSDCVPMTDSSRSRS